MFVVTVIFELNDGAAEEFLPAVKTQAQNSMQLEEGCHQFDVSWNENQPNFVFLYELYSNRSAFDDHLKSNHFNGFDYIIKNLVKHKKVQFYGEYFAGA